MGRFLQVLFDGNLTCKDEAIKKAWKSYETMKTDVFRVENFLRKAQEYTKGVGNPSMIIDGKKRREEVVDKIMKGQKPEKPEGM